MSGVFYLSCTKVKLIQKVKLTFSIEFCCCFLQNHTLHIQLYCVGRYSHFSTLEYKKKNGKTLYDGVLLDDKNKYLYYKTHIVKKLLLFPYVTVLCVCSSENVKKKT